MTGRYTEPGKASVSRLGVKEVPFGNRCNQSPGAA